MKNKIRSLASIISAAVLTAPVLAMAQFDVTSPGTTGLANTSIIAILQTGMRWLLFLVGILAVIAFVIAGILYLTAAGDEDRVKTAKNTMVYAIIGVIVALLGLVILTAINTWIGGGDRF